jgi:GNAT superfamily N-acetyltransferase
MGQPPVPRNGVALKRLIAHVRASTPSRAWLAEDAGQVIAFGAAADRDEMTFLAFLFLRPEAQGRGLGRTLYERCMPARGYRAVCVEAIQPVSTALYSSYGLTPREAIYTFIGTPRRHLPRLAPSFRLDDLHQAAADSLDHEVLGITRGVDHAAWRADRKAFALLHGGELLGYGYVQASGRLGPVVVRRGADLLPFVGSLINEVTPLEAWQLLVPGSASETFAALLHAGLRFDGPPALYCATGEGIDHSRYLPASYALP